ncbi:MAG TPA: hypothetical protein VMO76_14535 [Candidatus Udaeobacter sp.]|nr:hypothetical protein [Candidatus Udaeobacter sp.]
MSPIIFVDYENYLGAADTIAETDPAYGRMLVLAWTSGPEQPTGDA